MRFGLILLCLVAANAQVFHMSKEDLVKYTAKNPYERFEDGRPKVPDAVLERMRGLSVEEIWSVLPGKGYPNQFDGKWQMLHPEKKLVGRAVTAQFMPTRPDINDVITKEGRAKGRNGGQNQWVIDQLQKGDVVVVDIFGKIEGGTFVGDNLATAIYAATGTGMVIDGAIRDLEGIHPIDMAAYFRGVHPSAIANVMLTGFNIPVKIGNSTVVPGDVVFGDSGGVYFVPPEFIEEILKKADTTHVHDEWTKNKFIKENGKWKSSDLYPSPKDPKVKAEYDEYLKKKLGTK